MASVLDICNISLANLGDAATVSSIDPPEGSAQAEHCARFYPIARDTLLEMHDWAFASKRAPLAPLTNPVTQWTYCYACPADMINPIAVLDSAATDDLASVIPWANPQFAEWYGYGSTPIVGTPSQQPYTHESLSDGTPVIYTNQASALLRYTARVEDTTRFSPLFVRLLAAYMSSLLAGPVLKGDAGVAAAARWSTIAFGPPEARGRGGLFSAAAESDAGQKRDPVRNHHAVDWLTGR